ncbi:unnamed protein product [Mytilus coruscus]|uniref:Integrase zinc-binding domain-containing protein n=1 Tax=Mytilus coruscus TaxID=42192 RepID=A0A6J8A5R6_MYTCO|nr:unnamed protein product [Mytilus coruscus]
MKIIHRPGKQHISRIPSKQCGFKTIPQEDEKVIELVKTIASSEETSYIRFVEKQKKRQRFKNGSGISRVEKVTRFQIGAESMIVKTLWALFESLVTHKDILCHQKKEPKTVLQTVVPKSERRNVLTQYHDNRTSAHLGVSKTIAKIRDRYYWPVLQTDVKHYIMGNTQCSKRRLQILRNEYLCRY